MLLNEIINLAYKVKSIFCHKWMFQVLKSLHDRFHHIVSQENFPRVAQLVGIKTALITILESLCGVAEGTRIDNLQRLFSFFLPILQDCVRLLGGFPHEHSNTNSWTSHFRPIIHLLFANIIFTGGIQCTMLFTVEIRLTFLKTSLFSLSDL